MEGTFAVAPPIPGGACHTPPPPTTTTSPSNFRNFPTWLGVGLVPSGKHICEKKIALYFYAKDIFSDKIRKNLFIYVNTVSTELKDVLS